jgi:hypothetical protein
MSDYQYARVPKSVLYDQELTPHDIKAYSILSMHVFEGNICSIGQRRLSELANMDRRDIRKHLNNLAARGHIATSIFKLKGRHVYQLNSPIFGQFADGKVGGPERPQVGGPERPRIDPILRSRPRQLRRVK